MPIRFVLALVLAVGAGCAGKSSRSGDELSAGGGAGEQGGSAGVSGGSGPTGGSAGTGLGGDAGTSAGGSAGSTAGGSAGAAGAGDADCDDERRTLRTFINQNKSCSATADCTSWLVGCGISEDGCTGAVYTNTSVDPGEMEAQRERFEACLRSYENTDGCATCDRIAAPPQCLDGHCVGGMACALEATALWEFKSKNDACEVDDDCITETVGCEVTEDDCTGAVYFSSRFDREEFSLLRDEYRACRGSCTACRRIASPPACVSGHCVIRPLR